MKFLTFFFCLAAFSISAWAFNAEEILHKADRARGGVSDGLTWNIQLQDSGSSSASEYEVQVKGVDALVRCTAPARQKGELYLFNDRNLWLHRPGLKKPISLSPRQRLSGQAANGDIASTNYARDYEAKLEGEDVINGKNCFRLFLQAKAKNVTYDKLRYWVTKDTFLGVKAEFLTLDGKPFKSALFEYGNSVLVSGKKAPFVSKMNIEDAMVKDNKTTIIYTSPKPAAVPESLFNVNNLVR